MARRGENIYKRKDGRYEGRYIRSYDLSGKAIYGYIYSRSYTEIKKLLSEYKTKSKEEREIKNNISFDLWLEEWLSGQAQLKASTIQIYRSYINNHIKIKLGKIRLSKLNATIIQKFINELRLSPASIRIVVSIIMSALSDACEAGYINNSTFKIKRPANDKKIAPVLSYSEQKKLEAALVNPEDTGIFICLYAGLRIGEVCALKWKDIDFEASILTVNGTQTRNKNGVEITNPKSRTSKREIPIPDFLKEKLKAIYKNEGYVLSNSTKPIDVRTYRRHFKKLLKETGLDDIKFHSLRHTFATRALEVGMDYKTLSEILGHSSVGITLDLYAHSLKEHKINQMKKLDELFSKNPYSRQIQ